MAAGLGFKTFTTGEVLTAADVNGYLMQGVLVFATEAARNSAITSPQEGQFAFTKDTNSLWYYSGSAWVASGATGDIEGVTAGTGISGGGTSGTVTITNSMATAIDAKGDLVPGTGADTFSRLAVGANGTVLTADSAEATGLKWATPASGSTFAGCSLKSSTTSLAVANATTTVLTWDQEYFDSDGYHSTSSNTSRITIPSGKGGYYLFVHNQLAANPVASRGYNYRLYKNGAEVRYIETQSGANTSGYMYWTQTWVIDGAVTDYFEVYVTQNSTGSVNYFFDGLAPGLSNFSCTYLGA